MPSTYACDQFRVRRICGLWVQNPFKEEIGLKRTLRPTCLNIKRSQIYIRTLSYTDSIWTLGLNSKLKTRKKINLDTEN